ncbi:MAG: fibrobacter succinogenes major paralogous domain-containing protein [Bacteroidales bacterium]|nr:fibrobacter succinogenes major paralogous domain-containing protein [Bacteroidales bacterium]
MKKVYIFFIAVLFSIIIFAQSPQKLSYQAVIRLANNELVTNTIVGMQISILQTSIDGKVVYIETQNPKTNINGLVSIEIGNGITSDNFSNIDWAMGPYFIKTEIDPLGKTNYSINSVNQLLSVPFALHADVASSVSDVNLQIAKSITQEDTIRWNKNNCDLSGLATKIALQDSISILRSEIPDKNEFAKTTDIPKNLSELNNDAGYISTQTDNQTLSVILNKNNDGGGKQIKNIANPTDSQDAVTKAYVQIKASKWGDTLFLGNDQWLIIPGISVANREFSIATIETKPISYITEITAVSGGNITDNGKSVIITMGLVWSDTENPTIENNIGKSIDKTENTSYVSSINGLKANTTYYVRAYAINNKGIAYGNQVSFLTPNDGTSGSITDIYGNVYQTIKIGNQIWMAENLKTTSLNDNTVLPNIEDNTVWKNQTSSAYSSINNDLELLKKGYGYMYNLYAVETGKLCPSGWHIPTEADWTALFLEVGKLESANMLKQAGNSEWNFPNSDVTNKYGFTALPTGGRGTDGTFFAFGGGGFFWSIELDNTNPAYFNFTCDYPQASSMSVPFKNYGSTVRCIKD